MANNDPRSPVGGGPRPVETPRIPIPAKPQPIGDVGTKIAEADALALFIARRGNLLGDDDARKDAFKDLQNAIAAAKAGTDPNYNALLDAYARVSAFTYAEHGVNGRTILDTDSKGEFGSEPGAQAAGGTGLDNLMKRAFRPRNRPLLLGVTLFFSVAVFEGILLLTSSDSEYAQLNQTLQGAKKLLLLLVWGAIGTCIYLMKMLSDKLSAFAFEELRARGMGTRVFLGAILGLIVVELIGTQIGTEPNAAADSAGPAASVATGFPIYLIAFLAGLGIKPVYAAIEGLVEGLAARIKLPTESGKS